MGDLKKPESITGVSRPSDTELTRRAIMNARPGRGEMGVMRWVCVRDTFAVGSTTANILCVEAGLNPDELLDGGYCEGCPIEFDPCGNTECKEHDESEPDLSNCRLFSNPCPQECEKYET